MKGSDFPKKSFLSSLLAQNWSVATSWGVESGRGEGHPPCTPVKGEILRGGCSMGDGGIQDRWDTAWG